MQHPADFASTEHRDQRGTLFLFDLSQVDATPLPVEEVRCFKAGEADLARIEQAMDLSGEYPPGEPRRRWRRGRVPYVAAIGEEIVSYGWVTPEPEPMDDLGISFAAPPGDVWLFDFATVPAYRGRRFYPALLRYILGELKGQGIRRAWIGTEPGNIASERGISRAGFTKVAETDFIGRPGDGHFVIHSPPGIPRELAEEAARTVRGTLSPDSEPRA